MDRRYRRVLPAAVLVGLTLWAAMSAAGAETAKPAAEAKQAKQTKKIRVLVVTGGHGFNKKLFPKTFAGMTTSRSPSRPPRRAPPRSFRTSANGPTT